MNRRLETLQNTLPEGIDAALIGSPVNRRYYTGLASSAGVLFVTREHAELLIDFRYIEAARAAADGYTVTLQEALGTQLHALAVTHGVETVGVETGTLTLDEFALYREWMGEVQISTDCALNKAILRQRSRKSAEEIEQMQRAQDITDRCFLELLNFIRAGVSEREVANELARLIRQCGAERESFETIAVSGQKTSMPHGQPSDKLIGRGELFTLDCGVKLGGYCSDMTRTVAVGEISDEQRRVYETVLAAQQAALDRLAPGVSCREIDAAARDLIDAAGYAGCFGHGLGHSLGLEIHEAPAFSPRETAKTEPGMVMSVEPGVYLDGKFGCRIEDVIVITENGYRNLTHSPKKLIVL